jgi:NADH-quinone oxidoreductase subunit N
MSNAVAELQINLSAVLPEVVLLAFALVVMLVGALGGKKEGDTRPLLSWIALAGIVAAGVACVWLWGREPVSFQGQATSDRFALSLRLIVLVAAFLAVLLSHRYMPQVNEEMDAYYALLLLCTAGMGLMGAATDLIVLFVALEIFSLALYIMTGLNRRNARSTEASMKYFLLGAFASAFFAYGAALLYGATGATQYDAIAAALQDGTQVMGVLLYPAMALLVVGFGFKISVVPFHMWTPDVYQGAPTPVTAFMSVGTKAAAFAAFARLLVVAVPTQQATWGWAIAILALLTMLLGNLAALRQASLKRMLAYSSIAHAGYILTALAPGTAEGADAALFYLFTYAFMNIGAFAIVMTIEARLGEDPTLAHARGLAQRQPLLAFLMAVFMFGLSGIPPLAGFFGKFFVFRAAVDGGFVWLAVVGMLTSAIAAYYYIRVVVTMYFDQPTAETVEHPHIWGTLQIGLALAAAFTIVVGVLPAFWSTLLQSGFGGSRTRMNAD